MALCPAATHCTGMTSCFLGLSYHKYREQLQYLTSFPLLLHLMSRSPLTISLVAHMSPENTCFETETFVWIYSKKKVKKLVYAILFPEYLISTKSVSPACPFLGMRFTKISEIIIIIIVINICIIIISFYCGIVLAIRYSYYGITIQFKIMFFSFFV